MEIELIVVGEPRPHTVYTKRGRPSTGFERMQTWQEMIQIAARKAMKGRPPMDGPIYLQVLFCRTMPKTAPKLVHQRNTAELRHHFKVRQEKAQARFSAWHDKQIIKNPDRDNYQKAFSDALQGIVYHNDSQIIDGPGKKDYAQPGQEGYTWAVIRSND